VYASFGDLADESNTHSYYHERVIYPSALRVIWSFAGSTMRCTRRRQERATIVDCGRLYALSMELHLHNCSSASWGSPLLFASKRPGIIGCRGRLCTPPKHGVARSQLRPAGLACFAVVAADIRPQEAGEGHHHGLPRKALRPARTMETYIYIYNHTLWLATE
jgi:hypothetical protein